MQSHVVTMRETKQCSLKAMPEAIAWEGMLMWTPFNHDTSKTKTQWLAACTFFIYQKTCLFVHFISMTKSQLIKIMHMNTSVLCPVSLEICLKKHTLSCPKYQ